MFTKASIAVLAAGVARRPLLTALFALIPACAEATDGDDPATADGLGTETASGNPSDTSGPGNTAPGATATSTPSNSDAVDTSPTTTDVNGQTPMGGAGATADPTNVAMGGNGASPGTGGSDAAGGMANDTPAGGTGTGGEMSTAGTGTGGEMSTAGTGAGGDSNAGGGNQGEANPSPGCNTAGRPNDGRVYVEGESWLVFPEAYDGTTPFPVLWGFHGCGSGNRGDASRTEYTDATRNTAFASEYVVAIPLSSDAGGCWNYNNDIGRVKALYDELVNNYCVDIDHMFATGHSSGSYFAVALLEAGHAADAEHMNLRGMAPVAASPVNNHATPMPVLYMENPNDTERSDNNASTVVNGFRSANGCSDTSQPYDGADACNSSSGGAPVDAGCIIYDGCAQPTIWCSHNDQSYGTTGHGIPCFAAQAMDDFFKSL